MFRNTFKFSSLFRSPFIQSSFAALCIFPVGSLSPDSPPLFQLFRYHGSHFYNHDTQETMSIWISYLEVGNHDIRIHFFGKSQLIVLKEIVDKSPFFTGAEPQLVGNTLRLSHIHWQNSWTNQSIESTLFKLMTVIAKFQPLPQFLGSSNYIEGQEWRIYIVSILVNEVIYRFWYCSWQS